MHFYWLNGMRVLSLILIIILSSIKHHRAAEMALYNGDYENNQQPTYEINEAKRMLKNFPSSWGKGNENVMDNYYTQNMIPSYYDNSARKDPSFNNNYESNGDVTTVDKRLWKIFNEQQQGTGKRQGQSSWNNLRNGGWGKREGNWNNLRGLWGKRSVSSWDKLHGSWGRK